MNDPVPRYRRSRFDASDTEPVGPLDNLADIMLVFAVGLMVALAASEEGRSPEGVDIEAGRELPSMPEGMNQAGSGYEAVGRVYRDPDSGRLILIDQQGDNSARPDTQ